MGVEILTAAVRAKTPKVGDIRCDDLAKLTRAAVAADSQQASQLVERASSLRPDCADELNNLLVTNAANPETPGLFNIEDAYAFGIGFGPGFPGSPGFVGSPPSGSVSLPGASPTPVTSATNG